MLLLDRCDSGYRGRRVLSKIGNNKRGLSNLVAYVLLISITISLSVLVYNWLKTYTQKDNVKSCPDNVNVVIGSYDCFNGINGNITINLENKGLFDVDGFIIRVSDSPNAKFGVYTLDNNGVPLSPGDSKTITYKFKDYSEKSIKTISLVDVQPYILKKGKVACNAYTSQKVVCA